MLGYLIFGISYAFAAAIQPGPLQTYIIAQTLKKGWRKTLPAVFSPIISDIPIAFLILLLLSNVPDNFVIILRLAGGLFLVYLAYKSYKSWKEYDSESQTSEGSAKQTLFSAVIVNILNPNPYLGWSLIMGPMFIKGWQVAPANGIALMVGFYFVFVITLSAIIILFAFARKFGPQVIKISLGISALVLLLFGIYQLWLGTIFILNI